MSGWRMLALLPKLKMVLLDRHFVTIHPAKIETFRLMLCKVTGASLRIIPDGMWLLAIGRLEWP